LVREWGSSQGRNCPNDRRILDMLNAVIRVFSNLMVVPPVEIDKELEELEAIKKLVEREKNKHSPS
jgi:hypothetical protein